MNHLKGEKMEYRYLGKSGLQVSALSYGAWVTFNALHKVPNLMVTINKNDAQGRVNIAEPRKKTKWV